MSSLNNTEEYKKQALEIEAYLLEIPKFCRKNTLEETRVYMKELGNPGIERKLIHVAGTNGKGSVCAYLCSVLTMAGKKCGMFTSPHLVHIRERFRVGERIVSEMQFVKAFQYVTERLEAVRRKLGQSQYHPSFFELLFLMGMVIFEEENVEYCILETGLGGRLDTTNVIEKPLVTVITEIGMDHMEYLGGTIEEIAGEKAGIIKPGVPVVYCDKRKEASLVIEKCAKTLGSELFPVGEKDILRDKLSNKTIAFSLQSRYYDYIRLTLNTKALYQVENASLAVRALEVMQIPDITTDQIVTGIAQAHWEGRMEEVLPGVFVDGAHNEDGFAAFLQTVKADHCRGKRYMLYAASSDKDYCGMIKRGRPEYLFETIAVSGMNNERAADPFRLMNAFEPGACRYLCIKTVDEALQKLRSLKEDDDLIYVVGSLYLVGEVKALIKEENG